MELVPSETKLRVKLRGESKNKKYRHNELFPDFVRAIVCGPSGCGKTCVIISLIAEKNGLKFKNVYIFSKSLEQEKYKHLESIFDCIPEIGFYQSDSILPLDEIKPDSVIVFDDVISEKQSLIAPYFCMGRHKKLDVFFLTQTYTAVDKRLIRDNANLIIVFPQDNLNLKHIYNNHVSGDMKFENFQDLCMKSWQRTYGFLVINRCKKPNKGKYMYKFNSYYKK